MARTILIFLILIFNFFSYLHSQPNRHSNIWYFGKNAGLDFNSGQPIAINDGQFNHHEYGGASICDTNGNLLFYTDGRQIWNRDHYPMTNGFVDFHPGTQAAVIIPLPGTDNIYYVFTSNGNDYPYEFFYYVVDMTLANGMGEVVEIITLPDGLDAAEKLTAIYHKNKQDIWVITRKFIDDNYAAYLVTSEGVNPTPVLSPAPDRDLYASSNVVGNMKVSYDKKYLVTCYYGGWSIDDMEIEVCSFNDETGKADFLYSFKLYLVIPPGTLGYRTWGCEFSPDSKFLYVAGDRQMDQITHIFQFNMQYIKDSALFFQSAIKVGEGQGVSLQLASDGKIYCSIKHSGDISTYLGVIHKPWLEGTACEYESNSLNLVDKYAGISFPNFLTDYLFRFDFDGICESDTFTFDPWFFPEPVFIEWNFGDPASGSNNTSTIPHATHVFADGGTYEVSAYVEYPSGRIEETSREVEVEYAPEPDLGPDTSFCSTSGITLDAECGSHLYTWSTGAFGTPQITVSDTGWYWVRVENDAGCFEIDSIHLSFLPEAIADTSGLEVIPTTCGGSTGVIKGLIVSGIEPLSWQWIDDLGNPISSSLDIYHLPVGNYTLEVLDSNGCTTSFGPFTIIDAGDVLIDEVEHTNEHCGQQDGSIIINATSGLSDMLFYSIDNGANYYANQGVFSGLAVGSYAVRVRDSSNCQDVFINNPIIIENLDAPEILSVNIGACAQGQSNGSIEISALGGGDTLYYSNDNGLNFQINDGGFFNLLAGFYTCVVMDEVGCDTTFVVEVPEEITLRLQAIAGEDEVCPGNAAFVPLYVSNFNDVADFRTTLYYDNSLISCSGFANANSLLEDSLEVMLFPAEGKVELSWHAPPVTLPANTVLTDLVFESLDPGLSMVAWDGSAGASFFYNSSGLTIPVDYYLGSVRIYEEVFFTISPELEACQGDDIEIIPMLWTSNGPVSYLWTDPSGNTFLEDTLQLNNIQEDDSGTYSLKVTDTLDCYSDANIIITVHPTPIPAFSGQDTIVTEEPIELDAGDYIGFLWNTGETQRYITADYNDWYSVVIESALGCFGQDSVYVFFLESVPEPIQPEVFLPNAFTPDGDGLNDDFKVINPPDNIESFAMYIYNRWGQKVFETKDITHGWDGTFQGKASPAGTYVYLIENSIAGYDFDTNGTVVLIR